jgi:hypothetical protein
MTPLFLMDFYEVIFLNPSTIPPAVDGPGRCDEAFKNKRRPVKIKHASLPTRRVPLSKGVKKQASGRQPRRVAVWKAQSACGG